MAKVSEVLSAIGWGGMFVYLCTCAQGCQTYGAEEDLATAEQTSTTYELEVRDYSALPEVFRPVLQGAADEWCEVTAGRHCVEFVVDSSLPVHASLVTWRAGQELGFSEYWDGAAVGSDIYLIQTWPTVSADVLADSRVIFLHELGHTFGAEHLPAGNVMSVDLDATSAHLTAADVASVQ